MVRRRTRLPTGTLTFLFTDIEGSTQLLRRTGEGYPGLLDRHSAIVRDALTRGGGIEVSTEGDAFFAVFERPAAAVEAAVAIQRGLAAEAWPDGAKVRVRIGLHSGDGRLGGDNYVGLDVNRAARIAAAGHGGQVLLSEATRSLAGRGLPAGVTLRDLGTHALKDLPEPERLSQLVIQGLRADFPALRAPGAPHDNLPAPLTSFVGREREVAAVGDLLAAARLLTLTGPGGAGKSRLATRAAAELRGRFPDGVCYVALGAISDPELVAPAIASALALPPLTGAGSALARLADHLAGRRLLLVLDNFEQVLPAAPVVAELLRAAPELRVLVSSRAPLHVQGEQEYPVLPLELPATAGALTPEEALRSPAVRLFVDRAAAARPGFRLTDANAAEVVAIAARMDGLPLAIELAAARVKLLPPAALAARLRERLALPGAGPRDLPDRQRTLHGAVDWSYELLEPPVRRLFERFSVFMGGAALAQAEPVLLDGALDVLDGLDQLVDHSLVQVGEVDGEPRFAMLEVIRQYAAGRLEAGGSGQVRETRGRHAAAFLALAQEASPRLTGPAPAAWLDHLEAEHDNLRAAFAWLVADDPNAAARLVAALWRFWQMRGHLAEGAQRVHAVLERKDLEPDCRAGALKAAGGIAYWRHDLPTCRSAYEEALAIRRRLGDEHGIAEAAYDLAFPLFMAGDPRRAGELAAESLELYRKLGDAGGTARSLWLVGTNEAFAERLVGGLDHLREAVAMLRELDDSFHLGWALRVLGRAELWLGDTDQGEAHLRESLALFRPTGDVPALVLLLADLAHLALLRGRDERALRLAGVVAGLRRLTGSHLVDMEINGVPDLGEASARLGPERAERLYAEGEAMDAAAALAYALQDA